MGKQNISENLRILDVIFFILFCISEVFYAAMNHVITVYDLYSE